MRLRFLLCPLAALGLAALGLAALGLAASASGQQTGNASSTPTAAVPLPPPPTAPVGSGDSAARAGRAKIYVARGEAALAAGMRDTAKIAFEKALYENPACTDASVDLATIMTEDGDGLHARDLITRALQLDPTNPKIQHFSAHKRPARDSTPQ
jgi:Tfp pilus assembly protein PilF